MSDPVILIDGSGWLYRAFHALPPLTSATGEPSGAVYGMGNMLRRLLREHARERIVVIFDAPGRTFRDDLFAQYKANRDAVPDEMQAQFPSILEMIAAMGLPVLQVPGVEADDVIGTLAGEARAAGDDVLIVTGDKDLAQIVDDHVSLLDTMKDRRMDPAAVRERFGVGPECIVDLLALTGDTSDNIPGVPLVGPKTAAKWLAQHGSLDGVIAAADSLAGKAGENLRNCLAQLPLSRELARIRCDLQLPVTLATIERPAPDDARLQALVDRYGFKRWREDAEAGVPAVVTAVPPPPAMPAQPCVAECVLSWEQFEAMLANLATAEVISLDTETDALDAMRAGLVGVAFATEPCRGWYLPLAHRYVGAPDQLPMDEVLTRLRPLLEDAARPKVGQHIKYDLHVLRRHGVFVRGVRFDTMLESYVLDSGVNRHDMDSLSERHLNHRTIHFKDVAGRGKKQLSFDQVPIEQAAAYSGEDADVTLRLHQAMYPRLQQLPGLLAVFETIEMPLVPVLARIEETGVRVDVALLGQISAEFAQRMQALEAQAHAQAGTAFNLGSPAQLQKILFDQLQLGATGRRTAGGARSTAEDVLAELAQQHPLPQTILDWRAISKLRSTYTETLAREVNAHTGRIHTSYHQAAAATGRLSSSDPNLQNIPVRTAEGRRVRQAFIAAEGEVLLAVDYSQIELRLMAHFSGDERLQAAFRAETDVHRATAAEVFGLPLAEVGSEQRRAAKAINFGLIYGISAFGLARQLSVPRGEAQAYIDAFFQRYPGVRRFMEQTRLRAREDGYVETLFGRRLHLPEIRSKNAAQRQYAERTAINAPLQGTAADLIKRAMIDLHGWLPENAPGVKMILQVHDELVFEGPRERLLALAPRLCQRMCAAGELVKLSVPLTAEAGLGENWDVARSTPLDLAAR